MRTIILIILWATGDVLGSQPPRVLTRTKATIKQGDILSIEIDAKEWSIEFRKNGKEHIATITSIEPGEYWFAMMMTGEGCAVSFV